MQDKVRWIPSTKKMSFNPAEDVNTVEFKCIAPMYAMEEDGAFTSGELDRFFELDPNSTGVTNLTIATMVDFLANNIMFEICNNEEVIVVMRYLNRYITSIESIKNNDAVMDILSKCKHLRKELERLIRRIHPELFKDDQRDAIDIFSEFGG